MECFLTFVFMVIALLVVSVVASQAQLRSQRPNRAFRGLAANYHGVYQGAGWFGYPSSRFHYGDTVVQVSNLSTSTGVATTVETQWPDSELHLEVLPARRFRRSTEQAGLPTVTLGEERFDRQYEVWGNDADKVRRFLSEGVRWEIDKLRHLLGTDEIRVALRNGRLRVTKSTRIYRLQDLDNFTRLAMDLYDQGRLTLSTGIRFVDDTAIQLIKEAICQVCGDDITSDMVYCRRCKTPHHRDCWQYYGACSTYGCQETKYTLPTSASTSARPPDSKRW